MRSRTAVCLVALVLSCGCVSLTVYAEEGGSGHYMPGSLATFTDGVPPEETFVTRYSLLYYEGDRSLGLPLPIAALIAEGADVEIWANILTFLWRPPLEFGENISYAMSATIPLVMVDVSADVSTPSGATIHRSDHGEGLGDVILMPLMLNYAFDPDLSANFQLGLYVPTSDYQKGRLTNTGKNFWTIEPTFSLIYLGQKNGREAALFAGVDFNTKNKDTDYQSGTQIHFEGTLAQHFPFLGGLTGIGVSGFWYKQIEADSGAGAILGEFETMTTGLGPVLSHVCSAGGVDLVAELKWLHEIETVNRLEGSYVWLKATARF